MRCGARYFWVEPEFGRNFRVQLEWVGPQVRTRARVVPCTCHWISWTYSSDSCRLVSFSQVHDWVDYGTIHILCQHIFFINPNIFTNFLSNCFFLDVSTKNFKLLHQNVMLKNKFFCFDGKPSFCEKLGSQIKFCAKGQLISKNPFDVTKSSKKQRYFCKDFCPSL